ncbi:MAG: ribosome biogenesis GTPase Der [Terriglobales bacterium]
MPLLAIVGRPNVGKSTLFNKLTGSRRAIVGDEPGITRDRLYGEAEWRGHAFRVVDTGGIIPEDKDFIPSEIFRQAKVALKEAVGIIMVVDARTELAGPDRELIRQLQRMGKPLFLAVNKVDSDKQESLVGEFHELGIRDVFGISAEHGRGIDDLLDAVLPLFPPLAPLDESVQSLTTGEKEGTKKSERKRPYGEDERPTTEARRRPANGGRPTIDDQPPAQDDPAASDVPLHEIKVAIIGHPNVGKSTLLNRLTGSDRAIVSPIAGTTRDSIDEVVEYKGRKIRFIDTAGIRRKGKTELMAEKLSVVMARKNIESADIVLFMMDATEGVSALDANIAGYAHESGRSVIIVVNKWDLVASGEKRAISQSRTARIQDSKRPQDRKLYEERLRYGLKFLSYAPVLFISAQNGKGTEKILPLIEQVAVERRKRVTTSEMNRFLKMVDFDRASVPMSKRVRIYYLTQAGVAPPTFVLFTDRPVKLHFSYERFVENQIREAFGFLGTPIWIKSRASE